MKLYVWDCVDFGAYHEDGTAVVLAESRDQAIDLLMNASDVRGSGYVSYRVERENRPKIEAAESRELDVMMAGEPRVIAFNYGCDC